MTSYAVAEDIERKWKRRYINVTVSSSSAVIWTVRIVLFMNQSIIVYEGVALDF